MNLKHGLLVALIVLVAWPAVSAATATDRPLADVAPVRCTKPGGVQRLVFDRDKYPTIRRHMRAAIRRGWPRRLIVNRRGTDARRDRLLEDIPTKEGFDRDEYPPAVGRGKGEGLERGRTTRVAGRRACATSLVPRTGRTARRSATRLRTSATARASGTRSGNGCERRFEENGDMSWTPVAETALDMADLLQSVEGREN